MKLIKLFFFILVCTTASAQINKAALISVFGDRNLSDNPLDTKIYEAIMKDTAFNLTPIVNKFDKTIREKFLPQFPFPFLAKDEVVKAQGYAELKELTRWAKDNWYSTPADSYVPIAAFGVADDTDAIKKSFEVVQQGVDGVMIAYVSFNIYDAGGFGPMAKKKVYAYVNLKIFNKEGKRIFKLKERASSDEGVLAVGGIITDFGKLKPMIASAADNLLKDMEDKLAKSLAKMTKQMDKYNKD
ncbi:MAG: hypothetical protein ABI663_13550 [Chryseolinea sp.]